MRWRRVKACERVAVKGVMAVCGAGWKPWRMGESGCHFEEQ